MRRHWWPLLAVALALGASGCAGGSSESSTTSEVTRTGAPQTPSAHSAPKPPRAAHIIESFRAELLNQHVVQLRWTLASPAALDLAVAGVRHERTQGQTAGGFPIPPSSVGAPKPASKGPGTAEVNFELGEYNFKDYGRIQFELRARSRNARDASPPIILSRSDSP